MGVAREGAEGGTLFGACQEVALILSGSLLPAS